MDWLAGTWAVFRKDVRIELRSRYALNTLFLFVVGSLLLVLFAVGPQPLSTRVQAALLWIVMLFAASIGLGRSFVAEQEQGTVFLLQLNTYPSSVFAGKLLFNLLLIGALAVLAVATFLFLLDIPVAAPGLLVFTLCFGAAGLASATTLLAALVARAAQRGPLLPVLLLPLLIPLLVAGTNATRKAFAGQSWIQAQDELLTLVGFAGATISAGVVLFDFVWAE